MEGEVQDRLSSLPDAILFINISAASTSVLSQRWRYLWTGVTHFKLCCQHYETRFIGDVIQQLTSPKLYDFNLVLLEFQVIRLPNFKFDLGDGYSFCNIVKNPTNLVDEEDAKPTLTPW